MVHLTEPRVKVNADRPLKCVIILYLYESDLTASTVFTLFIYQLNHFSELPLKNNGMKRNLIADDINRDRQQHYKVASLISVIFGQVP